MHGAMPAIKGPRHHAIRAALNPGLARACFSHRSILQAWREERLHAPRGGAAGTGCNSCFVCSCVGSHLRVVQCIGFGPRAAWIRLCHAGAPKRSGPIGPRWSQHALGVGLVCRSTRCTLRSAAKTQQLQQGLQHESIFDLWAWRAARSAEHLHTGFYTARETLDLPF